MRVAFLVLAHERLDLVARLLSRLTGEGDLAVLHWDGDSADGGVERLGELLDPVLLKRVLFAPRRKVQWARWSMVEAMLSCLDTLNGSGSQVDYVVALSGSDYPVRPVSQLKAFLAAGGMEYIECYRPRDGWIVHGHREERFLYRHWGNWRDNPKWMAWTLLAQRKLGLRRNLPEGLRPFFGSQWWALTHETANRALAYARRPQIARFFRTVAVPDEMFFQSFVGTYVPRERIAMAGPTFYMFTPEGRAVTFYNDHAGFLLRQRHFFARKISPHAGRLRDELDRHCRALAGTPPGFDAMTRDTTDYRAMLEMHRAGLPNRRIMGGIDDDRRGAMIWNILPFCVIVAPDSIDVGPLRRALNARAGVSCFGALFSDDRIAYDHETESHPAYPADATGLRDHSPANFLFDMLQYYGGRLVGFVVRSTQPADLIGTIVPDRNALIVLATPETAIEENSQSAGEWRSLLAVRDAAAGAGNTVMMYHEGMSAGAVDALVSSIVAAGRDAGAITARSSRKLESVFLNSAPLVP